MSFRFGRLIQSFSMYFRVQLSCKNFPVGSYIVHILYRWIDCSIFALTKKEIRLVSVSPITVCKMMI